jgi:2,4-dienoyl-CoA reductase-like NADH-dependent reductase (Old Yellow Enzyme family)
MSSRAAAPQAHYPNLLAPLALGPVTLKHRMCVSAHGMGLGDKGPGVSPRYHEYLLARARGGAALVGLESCPIHPTTFSRSLVIRLDQDECIPSIARLAEAIHAAGSKLAATLWHGGHKDGALRGAYSVSPSPIPSMDGSMPHVLTIAEIADIVAAYGAAARRCRAAGVDVLEVQTATDYLLGSFLSPALNHRDDAYGGSRENRLRIVVEVLQAVRAAAGPELAVGVRCSARHAIPNANIDYTLDESLAAMRALDTLGLVDYVSVMSGSAWAEGVSIPAMHYPRTPLQTEGQAFKSALQVPVLLTARIRSAAEAEGVLASGAADGLAMARTWIAEPDWARKIIEQRESQIRPCMSCNQGCVGSVFRGIPGTCVLNPSAGREFEHLESSPALRPTARRLAVIGGGPAGLETARLAAEHGYAVTLYEREMQLGGQWLWAGQVPGRQELLLALGWWRSELRRLGVRVVLGHAIERRLPEPFDHVVWAVGSEAAQTAVWRLRPFLRTVIGGAESAIYTRDYFAGHAAARGKAALIDEEHGWSGLSAAAQLLHDSQVESVTVFSSESNYGAAAVGPTFETTALAQLRETHGAKLIIYTNKMVQSIDKSTITTTDNQRFGPFGTVLLATGTAARIVPEGGLAAGDCVAPRGMWSATSDALRVVAALDAS